MAAITLIDDEFATLIYHPEKKIIHHCFHKAIAGEALKKVLLLGTETLEKYGATKWLSDDRNNMALPPEDVEWGNTVWFPQTLKAGWKSWGYVVPDDFMARMNMTQFVQGFAAHGIRVMVFASPEKALAWLETL
jgi:hypothetical protein